VKAPFFYCNEVCILIFLRWAISIENILEEKMDSLSLYRIIDFETFVDLMLYGEERYVNPRKWDDTYEGYIFRMLDSKEGRGKLIEILYEHYEHDELRTVSAFGRLYSSYSGCYAQCWSATEESDALWRIYSYGKHSIRIGTKVSKVKDVLKKNGHSYGKVVKIDYNMLQNNTAYEKIIMEIKDMNSTYYGFSHKRAAFKHENEYRAMFMNDTAEAVLGHLLFGQYKFEYREDAKNIEEIVERTERVFPYKAFNRSQTEILKVDINEYIDSILVNPFAEDWYVERVRRICEMKEIGEKFLGRSTLYQMPFKQSGI